MGKLESTDYLSILTEIKKLIEANNTDSVALRQGLLSLEQVFKRSKIIMKLRTY